MVAAAGGACTSIKRAGGRAPCGIAIDNTRRRRSAHRACAGKSAEHPAQRLVSDRGPIAATPATVSPCSRRATDMDSITNPVMTRSNSANSALAGVEARLEPYESDKPDASGAIVFQVLFSGCPFYFVPIRLIARAPSAGGAAVIRKPSKAVATAAILSPHSSARLALRNHPDVLLRAYCLRHLSDGRRATTPVFWVEPETRGVIPHRRFRDRLAACPAPAMDAFTQPSPPTPPSRP